MKLGRDWGGVGIEEELEGRGWEMMDLIKAFMFMNFSNYKIIPIFDESHYSVSQETPSQINSEIHSGIAHINCLKTGYKSILKAVREATCYSSKGSSLGETVSVPP